MEHGAFQSPLNEFGLAELGRAAYNWGMADMLAEMLLGVIAKTLLNRELIQPLMIQKKAQILRKRIDDFPEGDCRRLVDEFSKAILSANGDRNHIIHGFWGWTTPSGEDFAPEPVAHSYKAEDKPKTATTISEFADGIAVATRKAHEAFMLTQGATGPFSYPLNFWVGDSPPPGW